MRTYDNSAEGLDEPLLEHDEDPWQLIPFGFAASAAGTSRYTLNPRSMHHPPPTPGRVFWTVCGFLLLLPAVAAAAEPALAIDFDGDGRHDHVLLDSREPSVLHVWLSASATAQVIHSSVPLLAVVATDLDGDHRAELIARDSASHIHVWTKKRKGFHSYRRRKPVPGELQLPTRRSVNDHKGQPAGLISETKFEALPLRASPRAPTRGSPTGGTPCATRGCRLVLAADPFAPRPPPTHLPL